MENPSEQSKSGSNSVKQAKSGNHDSEDDKSSEESEAPSDTAENVPVAVRKLYDPSTQSRTRAADP